MNHFENQTNLQDLYFKRSWAKNIAYIWDECLAKWNRKIDEQNKITVQMKDPVAKT